MRAGAGLVALIAVYAALLFADLAVSAVKELGGNRTGPSPRDFKVHHEQGDKA